MRNLVPPSSKISKGDVGYAAIEAALGAVPGFGSTLSGVLKLCVASPAEKRMHEFLEEVASILNRMQQSGVSLNELVENETFQEVVATAIQSARRTANTIKRRALLGCIESSTSSKLQPDLQTWFVKQVDDLSPSHLYLLDAHLKKEIGGESGLTGLQDNPYLYAVADLLGAEQGTVEFIKGMLKELLSRGLIANPYSGGGTSLGSDNLQKMVVSKVGCGLLDYLRFD